MTNIQCKKCFFFTPEWCPKKRDSLDPDLVRDCQYYRTKTNADVIRKMTDEELAEYLFDRGNCAEYCYGICAYQDECDAPHAQEFCIEQIIKWLKQEAKE